MFETRPYEEKDYDFVYEVKKLGYQKYVEQYYGAWDDSVQHEMFESYLAQRKDMLEIIVANGEDVGIIDGCVLEDGRYEQGNICLLPKARGQGIGSKVLETLIKNNPCREIVLRVFKSNPAVKLYERFGFEIVGETNTHYNMSRKQK